MGIYVEKNRVITNIVKDYDLGMDLGDHREVKITLAKGEEATSEKVEQTKKLFQKRLDAFGAKNYLIKANYITGEIILVLEENEKTDKIAADVYDIATVKMVDSEDKTKVFMTNEDIEKVSVLYGTNDKNETQVYLNLEFTEEGAKIIENLSSNEYKTIKKEEKEESENEKSEVVAGPYHEAFGQLVEDSIWYDSILEKIKKFNVKVKEIEIEVNPENINNVVGHKKENIQKLKDLYDVDVKVKQNKEIKLGKFEIKIIKTYTDFLDE